MLIAVGNEHLKISGKISGKIDEKKSVNKLVNKSENKSVEKLVGKSVGKKCDLLACAFNNTLLLMLVLFDIVYIILLLKLEMKENWQVGRPLQPCAAGDILKSIFEHFKRGLFGFGHF